LAGYKGITAVSGALPEKNPIFAGNGCARLDDNPRVEACHLGRKLTHFP